MEDDDDFEIDEWDEALEECGFSPVLGACMLVGTEHCDFECPFRDHPELLLGEDDG